MSTNHHDIVVLRWAEIFLKGGNRPYFEQAYVDQLARMIRGIDSAKIDRVHTRVMVDAAPADIPRVMERVARLFGTQNYSPARRVNAKMEDIAAVALDLMRAEVARRGGGRVSFRVAANRQDKSFPLKSIDIAREIGARVHMELGLPVDLHEPDITLGVEIGHKGRNFVYSEVLPGPGGLPVGATGKVNLLLSGGIDSPVAGWLAQKRGCALTATYFHSFPFTGDKTKEKVIDLCRALTDTQGPIALNVVHFTEVQKKLRECAPGELAVVMYRRMMLRAAAVIARNEGALALVTGDNLAQVASQTLENMTAIEDASPLPVLRPLLTYDKQETIALAKRIGTYETSIQPYDDCCALFVPPHPATKARTKDANWFERDLGVDEIAVELAARAERIVVE